MKIYTNLIKILLLHYIYYKFCLLLFFYFPCSRLYITNSSIAKHQSNEKKNHFIFILNKQKMFYN